MTKIFIFFLFLLTLLASSAQKQKQVYIVHFGGSDNGEKALHEIQETHHSYLLSVKDNEEEARASHLYSYKHSINGFSAVLTPDEAARLSELEEVVSVYPSHPEKYSLQTTRSWEFVGLDEVAKQNRNHFNMGQDLLSKARYGQDVIVGLVDSGVWPESKSFSDEGMGPVPESWKGICQTGVAFNSSLCNKHSESDCPVRTVTASLTLLQIKLQSSQPCDDANFHDLIINSLVLELGRLKIIGARYYLKGFEQLYGPLNATEDDRSPRDMDGHGTHTASTVAGRRVPNASAFGGFAEGTASGGAPLARLAIYKACWATPKASKAAGNTCFEADMLAAIDDAIRDGVHVLSISIGTNQPFAFNRDGIAIGALNAVKHNILVACSAGNSGPAPSSLSNPAPWLITVGAGSLDRDFVGPVVLGNGMEIIGKTVTPYNLKKMHPLVYAADVVVPGVHQNETNQCLPGSLTPEKVKGKIVLCMRGSGFKLSKGMEVKRAGGVGLILGNSPANGNEYSYDAHYLPATAVLYDDAIKIHEYIKSTNNPTAIIKQARTVLHTQPAPFMANFTSRGPNALDPYILKPDITAPGLNILAAWSEASSPSKLAFDKRIVKYTIFSGTSMSCPHVAAAAALLKAIHPDWSSAAIRSALMTTAWMKNNKGLPITNADGSIATPFSFGSGHFRPTKAADPGLVYDASYEDYLLYLCSHGFSFTNPVFRCPNKPPSALNLNYPSIAIPNLNGTVIVKRTVTNVGGSKSVYFFSAKPPMGVSVKANPSILFFDHIGQKKSFTITVRLGSETTRQGLTKQYVFGWYRWTDGLHLVRSPMAVSFA
ncbi:hypothetical protein WN943_012619 [Citrus x changshan-huyou]